MTGHSRLRVGELFIDVLRFEEALDAIEGLVREKAGGSVFTPNVDHIVLADENPEFKDAYKGARLSLVDGMPIVWVAPLLGAPLPEKISGSDLVMPLMARAAARRWRVYLMGAGPGIAQKAADKIREQLDVQFVAIESPKVDLSQPPDEALLARIRAAKPDVVFVALGSPKQEIWCHRVSERLAPAVLVGVGASFDFLAGAVKRAPPWVSRLGFEWLFRLALEPRRLWRRYLVQDPKFVRSVLRTLRLPKGERVVRSEQS